MLNACYEYDFSGQFVVPVLAFILQLILVVTAQLQVVESEVEHAALRRKSKDWLAQNRDNVSEWDDMSIRGLLFQ
jgi:hypothetical protein